MSEFFRTQMGRKFYDADIPQLVKVLERIATQMEKKNKLDEKKWLLEEKLHKLSLREAKNNS
tara:strand:+ start:1217 stop:1402 length:186 start_codon:yes stop_codon:yes gene_type:complete